MFKFRSFYAVLFCICIASVLSSCGSSSLAEQQRVDEYNRNNVIVSFMAANEQICTSECERRNMRKIEYLVQQKLCGCALK